MAAGTAIGRSRGLFRLIGLVMKHNSPASDTLAKIEELGGKVYRHIAYGLTKEKAQSLQSWCMMQGYDATYPVQASGSWSVTVNLPRQ